MSSFQLSLFVLGVRKFVEMGGGVCWYVVWCGAAERIGESETSLGANENDRTQLDGSNYQFACLFVYCIG